MTQSIFYHQKGKDPLYKTWHAQEDIMIIRTYSFGGSVVVGEKAYPITDNTICLVGAGRFHYTMPDDTESYDRTKIFISKEDFSSVRKLISKDSFKNVISEDSFIYAELDKEGASLADSLLYDVYKANTNDRYSFAVLTASFIRLITLIDKYSVESTASVGYMGKAVEFIGNNICADLDIDKICRNIHMSKYYFCRKFKEHTGMTVMGYILATRLMMAKDILCKENISVSEVSEKCGFSSISYFCKVFKENTGMSPLKYRKSLRDKI